MTFIKKTGKRECCRDITNNTPNATIFVLDNDDDRVFIIKLKKALRNVGGKCILEYFYKNTPSE